MFKELNILGPFFEDPLKEYNVREIARLLKISPATISKRLKELSKKNILSFKKERGYDLYNANLESDSYRDLKLYYSIRKIKDSNLIEEINLFYIKPTIILFGSTSTGYDVKESDIDLVIISEKNQEFPKKGYFEKKLNKNLQLFLVKDLKDLRNSHLINNVLNGIVLQGEFKWN